MYTIIQYESGKPFMGLLKEELENTYNKFDREKYGMSGTALPPHALAQVNKDMIAVYPGDYLVYVTKEYEEAKANKNPLAYAIPFMKLDKYLVDQLKLM